MWSQDLFCSVLWVLFTSYFRFLNANTSFSLIFPFNGIPLFEAAILVNEQNVKIFEMPLNQFLTNMMNLHLYKNSKPLPHLAQLLHASAGLGISFPTLLDYSCAKSPIGCSDFDHMYAVCDTWWKTPGVFSSGILLVAQVNAGDSRRDQDTSDLDLQWDARWKHWSKHDTASIQADYVLQCNIQFNPWTKHTLMEMKIYTRGWRWIRPIGLCHRGRLIFW